MRLEPYEGWVLFRLSVGRAVIEERKPNDREDGQEAATRESNQRKPQHEVAPGGCGRTKRRGLTGTNPFRPRSDSGYESRERRRRRMPGRSTHGRIAFVLPTVVPCSPVSRPTCIRDTPGDNGRTASYDRERPPYFSAKQTHSFQISRFVYTGQSTAEPLLGVGPFVFNGSPNNIHDDFTGNQSIKRRNGRPTEIPRVPERWCRIRLDARRARLFVALCQGSHR